jgi:hypothetical protein
VKSLKETTLLILIAITLLSLSGCLSTEYKEYIFKINSDDSGTGQIIFHNIVSAEDDGKNVSFKDFGELVSDYMEGTRFEDDNPGYLVTNKELFEEDSILSGKVEFTFTDFRSIGFYKTEDCDCSQLMYYIGDFGETFSESSGTYLGEEKDFPVIVWPSDTDEIFLKTIVQEDLNDSHSLMNLYHTWKDSR